MHGHPTITSTRRGRSRRRIGALLPAAALLGTGLVVVPQLAGVADAASFVQVPERLYMVPAGVTVPNLIAGALDVKVGTLEFDGSTDPISQDVRTIEVSTLTGSALCNLTVTPRDIDDCSRIQIGPVSHGRLSLGPITTIQNGGGPGIPAYMLANDVRIDSPYQVAAGSFQLGINGEPDDLNAILADLVYTPDPGYYYEGSNGETINIQLVPGNSDDNLPEPTTDNDTASASFEVRVLNVNDFPTLTVPADKQAQAGVELLIPPVAPSINPPFAGSEFSVADPDNDEDVDGAQANPPVAEEPLIDGADDSMLLVGYLDCGVPTVDGVSGFSLRGGTFQLDNNSIRSIVRDVFDFTQLPQEGRDAVDAVLTAIDVIEPGLTDLPLATNDPTIPTDLFAAVGSMSEVQYALSQMTFLQPAQNDTCTMWTAVSDLGNNGLPIQYFGSPPTGVEVPMIGLAIDSFEITTGELTEIDVSFTTPNIFVLEGSANNTALTQIEITPGTHPEFQIRWNAVDGPVVGGAVAGSDYAGTSNNNPFIGQNVPRIPLDLANVLGSESPIQTNVFNDNDIEGPETFTFEIEPGAFAPPPGYTVTSATPEATVTIIDDDGDPNTVSVGAASVVEGDTPDTTILNVPVTLSGLARGNEQVTISTGVIGGEATSGVDFTPVTDVVVNFAVGEMEKLVPITVIGDDAQEGDEDLLVTITSNVTVTTDTAIATITDDDGPEPQVSINDFSANEGNAGTTNFTFTISLVPAAVGGETIQWSTQNGAATAPSDYAAVPATTITFAPGQEQQTVTVVVNGDTAVEPGETFFVNLANAVGLVPVDAQGQGTILNDDSTRNVSIADVSIAEGDAGTSTMTFALTVSPPAVGGESVQVNDAPGTASEPGDYTFVGPQTVTFSPGDTSATVTVTVNGDTTPETNENFTLSLSNAAGGLVIADGQATGVITDDDTEVPSVVSIADGSVTEGLSGVTTISMTNPAGRTCSVSVTSTDVSAEAPGDYDDYAGGTFNLVNVASDVLGLSAVDDDLVEGPETYTLTIALLPASNVNCVLGDAVATVTITSDDVESVVSIADGSVAEGATGTTTISMTNSANRTCSVSVTSTNGTASAPGDYDAFSGGTFNLVNLPSDTLSISANDDADVEGTESFTLTIALLPSSDGQCTLGDATATILIVDTDSPVDTTQPTVTINQFGGQVDPTSVSPIQFRVDFSEPVTGFDQPSDVILSGSAGATTVQIVPVTTSVYSVFVSGMTQSGLVIADVAADAAQDGAGNLSLASTSTDNEVQFNLPPADTTSPTVTINQFGGQVDPTSVSPIQFRVDFSEPVTGFDQPSDVILSGSAGATTVQIVPVTTSVYSVFVSGMTQSGLVVAQVVAGAATDLAGNPNPLSTSTDNEVTFDLPLTLNLPPNQTVNNDPGLAGAIVNYPMPTAVGGVEPYVFDCSPISGAFFPLGVNTVTCTVTDAEGVFVDEGFVQEAIVSGTFTITVIDNEPPTIADNPDLTRETVGNAPVTVTFPLPAASDNSGVAPTVVCTPASGSPFGIGIGTVTCTATDAAGNSASSSFTVTVTSTGSGVPGPTTPPTTAPPTTNPIFGLPATGSDPLTLLLVAIVLLSGGAVLVATTRRRRTN